MYSEKKCFLYFLFTLHGVWSWMYGKAQQNLFFLSLIIQLLKNFVISFQKNIMKDLELWV